ncbi:MAG: hypothetical protein K2K17_07390 [Lachnospiraceae bacterium]|nr:hypothetical protein [Lachnospiraceae bacterium]
MAIELKQYTGQTVTAQDDAIMNDQLYGLNGVIAGCSLHFISVNVVNIKAGWGIIKGRLFKITETTLNCMLPNNNGVGIVKIKMDLLNKDHPAEILSVAVEGNVYPDLEQNEWCNYNNGIYEIELARYTASPVAITDFKQTFELLREKSIQGMIKQASITKAVLAAGKTSVTIKDNRITTNSVLSFYTSIYNVNPTAVTVSNGSVTLTFKAQTVDIEVGVRVNG